MQISFLELRRNPGKLLEAIERNEEVTISRRGKSIARVIPNKKKPRRSMQDHPSFGMWKDRTDIGDPTEYIHKLRQPRYRDL